MAILTHGSDLSLSPTLGPIVRATDGTVKTAFTRIAEAGFHSVQLDATLSGIRPRDLDATGRRDLSASARRSSLQIGGIDLLIPRSHYADPQHTDRAIEATLAAIRFAGELGRLPLSVNLPIDGLSDDVTEALLTAADAQGVVLVVHAEDQIAALRVWLAETDTQVAGIGLDPANLLGGRSDPAALAQSLAKSVVGARLSDNRQGLADGSRCPVGTGDLDVMGYRIGIDLAPHRRGPVVLDLRGLSDPLAAAATAQQTWDDARVKL
jgi:sugar phosphate isomerase/epimerase